MSERDARRETSAGGVVVRPDGATPSYLLIRDSYRNWGFPKGHVKEGESVEAAACREVTEETGLRRVDIRARLHPIEWTFRFRGAAVRKTCHFFLMETADTETTPQRSEGITACRWATFDEAERLIGYENARAVLRAAHAVMARDNLPRAAG